MTLRASRCPASVSRAPSYGVYVARLASESVLSIPVTVPGDTFSAWASSPVLTALPGALCAAISAIVLT